MNRISRANFPNHRPVDLSSKFYASIFIRDVHAGIMPYRHQRNPDVLIELCQTDEGLSDELKKFLYVGHYGSAWRLRDTILDSMDALAHYLAVFGEQHFEIVDTSDEHKGGTASKKLERFPYGKVIKVFNRYVQLVPLSDWKRNEKKLYIIPASRIWHIKLPRKLGRPYSHRKLLKRLAKLSTSMPEFANRDGDLGQSANYEPILHNEKRELAVEQLLVKWGSIPSLHRLKHTTEYYRVVRNLQFLYSQALLREHILSEMNDLIRRLGVDNKIMVSGIGVSAAIGEAIRKLERGEIGFSEALEVAKDLR